MLASLGLVGADIAGLAVGPHVRWALWALLVVVGLPALVAGLRAGSQLVQRVTPRQQGLLAGLFVLQLVNFGVAWAHGLEQTTVRMQGGQLALAFAAVWVTWRAIARSND